MPNCAHCGAHVPTGVRQCSACGVTLSGRDHATQPGLGHSSAPTTHDPMIGRSIIDQFVVRSKIGEGGMGGVYLADQPSVGRTAVIKVIHPWLSKDQSISARFAAEARAAARLQHPHIVAIYNYGKLPDSTLFLAMEHIQGLTLAQTLQSNGRLEPSRAVNIATQCCEALSHAHRRGVVHRDVKPSNIMLQTRHQGPGFAKMLDFGVATIDDRDAAPGRSPAGTPCYMSPEQLAGGTVDGRSDIYSLAIVIYEMLVGQPPFLAPSTEAYTRLHREVPPPAPTALVPEVRIPPALEACLMRALAKTPHARPQSAERFAEELWAAVMATATSLTVRSDFELARRSPARPGAARRVAVFALGGLAATGIATGLYMRWNPDDGTTAAPSAPPAPTASNSQPHPAQAALMRSSIVELKAELERVAVLSGRGSAAVAGAMTAYHEHARQVPAGQDPELHRR
ncbi:MAG: serine/threonine protein kinase, partial [Deltaproteobacteria bacterium]|nr:serine/threonine protein kinase [Deltaproteobacteria bacterium]